MAAIEMEGVSRAFGATPAVDRMSLAVPSGTFLALLGPSGCGKTTLLRLIAGLERPDAGWIALGERVVAGRGRFVPPEARGLGMVFQSYALWPHMTIAGNIRFGLRAKRMSRAEEQARIGEALEMVGLTGMQDRRPHELSGGQRQRVALARSLAVRPGLILLDEPLANLDAHLRETMLAEFRRIHAASRTTFVFVTHDQDEAMAVAGLVGVMNRGRLEQLASPSDLYRRPATPMVARFVGHGRTLPVHVTGRENGLCRFSVQGRSVVSPGDAPPGPGWLCLRAGDLAAAPGGGLRARVLDHRFQGGSYRVTASLEGVEEGGVVEVMLPRAPASGERIELSLRGGWVLSREAPRGETAFQDRLLAGATA
ncbi:ABC transporter ATP-binding protein [Celeribacter indicus]|uniref:ABC transporter n=1 Tax=Celeribacter indicus TaxID=1208324 RepID=A0A0B5DRV5_9RHOB|nr:ABC transporter ATP-binding protein [Celeribacter indicus]AJE45774.1 ABC transporter [Celeribacter indicus]SDW60283.1 carbohydrate ABC transporter ATP-binding protein, CUT1 family [Celeribacter indicus]